MSKGSLSLWALVVFTAGCDPTALLAGSVEQLAEECVVDVDGSTLHCPDRQGGLTTAPLRYAGADGLPTILDALTASDPKVQIVAAMQLHNAYAAPDALDPAKLTAADAASLLTRVGALPPNVKRRAVAFTVAAGMPHDPAGTRAFLADVQDPEGRVRGWSAVLKHSPPTTMLADVERVRTLTTDSPFPDAEAVAFLAAARMRQVSPALDEVLCSWGTAGLEGEAHSMAASLVERRCPDGKAIILDNSLAAAAEGALRRSHVTAVHGWCDASFAKVMGESLPEQCPALREVLEATARNPKLADDFRGEALKSLAVDWPDAATETLITSVQPALPEETEIARKLLEIRLPK